MPILGLIGFPLEHSFSQQYFTQKFQKEGLQNYEYKNFPIRKIKEFPVLLQNQPDLIGLNVTTPHKQTIIPFLDELSVEAEQIRAVNTIKIEEHNLTGFNTDVYGFTTTLKPLLPGTGIKALVLGTGGAAQAIKYGLTQLNIPYQLVSRHQKPNCLTYQELKEKHLNDHRLIINTTPLGMAPETDQSPNIPYQAATSEHIFYDLIYNPEITQFLQKGKEQGATIKNGKEMLYQQAEKSWETWTR